MAIVTRLKWSLTFLFILFIAGVTTVIIQPSLLKIQAINLELVAGSNEAVLFDRIRTSLKTEIERYENKFFWQVPLKRLREIAAHDRRVKNVSIYREFPSRVYLQIEPHTPVLALLRDDGRLQPVAADATLLPPLNLGEAPDVPFLRGPELFENVALREKALSLISLLPESGPLRKKFVSEVIYTKKNGFDLFLSEASAEIKVGDSDFGPKVARVQQVLSYLNSQNLKGRVIDARFSKKVVVRVRNTP